MTPLVQNVTTLISIGGIIGQFFVMLVSAGFALPRSMWLRQFELLVSKYALPLVILFSGSAMVGSLFYSEIAGFVPCALCIIQRWFLYPIPFIGALGFSYGKKRALKAVAILSFLAFTVALYQYVLQFQAGTSVFCTPDAPCNKVFFVTFGYITIPFLSLVNSLMLLVTAVAGLREKNNQ